MHVIFTIYGLKSEQCCCSWNIYASEKKLQVTNYSKTITMVKCADMAFLKE